MTAGRGAGCGAGGCGAPPVIACTAAAALSSPPVATLPAREATGVVVERIARRMSAAVARGLAAASRATVPVTKGTAIDVPLNVA